MSQHLCGMFKSTEGGEVIHLMRRTRRVSHLLLESRVIAKIHLIAERVKAGGRLSQNTTEVWWYGIASVESGVALLQNITVLMSACYQPSDEPEIAILDLIAERAATYSKSARSNQSGSGPVFVFGVIHSNTKNRTIGASFIPGYCPQFTLTCRKLGIQNVVYIEYDWQMFESEDSTSSLYGEELQPAPQTLRAQVVDIDRGVRYFTHVSQCFHPPQSIAERRAFVEEFLSHVEVSKAQPENGKYEEELKRLLSSLRPHQRRLLKGGTTEEGNDLSSENGEIDREE